MCISLYSLGEDPAESAVFNSFSITAIVFVAAETRSHVFFTGRYHAKDDLS
jgi:hypothetical protein